MSPGFEFHHFKEPDWEEPTWEQLDPETQGHYLVSQLAEEAHSWVQPQHFGHLAWMALTLAVLQLKRGALRGEHDSLAPLRSRLKPSSRAFWEVRMTSFEPSDRIQWDLASKVPMPMVNLEGDSIGYSESREQFATDFAEGIIEDLAVHREALDGFLKLIPDDLRAVTNMARHFTSAALDTWVRDGKKEEIRPMPPAVVHLVSTILEPQPGCTIHDPSCGVGGWFLPLLLDECVDASIQGAEIHGLLARLAQFILIVNEFEGSIRQGDLLENPPFADIAGTRKYDLVLLDPPMGHRLTEAQREFVAQDSHYRFEWGDSSKLRSEMLFLSHALESCNKDGGRLAALLHPGCLFGAGEDENVRGLLTRKSPIPLRAVIELPGKLFGLSFNPSLVLFDSRFRGEGVLFVDGTQLDHGRPAPSQHVTELWSDEQAETDVLAEIVRSRRGLSEKAVVVEMHQMEKHRFSWEVKKYLPGQGEWAAQPIQPLLRRARASGDALAKAERKYWSSVDRLMEDLGDR